MTHIKSNIYVTKNYLYENRVYTISHISTPRDRHQLAEQLFTPRSYPRSRNLRMRVWLFRSHVFLWSRYHDSHTRPLKVKNMPSLVRNNWPNVSGWQQQFWGETVDNITLGLTHSDLTFDLQPAWSSLQSGFSTQTFSKLRLVSKSSRFPYPNISKNFKTKIAKVWGGYLEPKTKHAVGLQRLVILKAA